MSTRPVHPSKKRPAKRPAAKRPALKRPAKRNPPTVRVQGILLRRPPAKGGSFRLRVHRAQQTAEGRVEGYDDLVIHAPPALASVLRARPLRTVLVLQASATPKGILLRSLA